MPENPPVFSTGNGRAIPLLVGRVRKRVSSPIKAPDWNTEFLSLKEVYYVPTFPYNVISQDLLEKNNIYLSALRNTMFWNSQQGKRFDVLRLKKFGGIRALIWDDQPLEEKVIPQLATVPVVPDHQTYPNEPRISRDSRPVSKAPLNDAPPRGQRTLSARDWHLRLGHCNREALDHLEDVSRGVKIIGKGPRMVECDVCATSKAKAIISKKTPASAAWEPGSRLMLDFFWGPTTSKTGQKRYLLWREEVTGFLLVWPIVSETNLVVELDVGLRYWQNQYGIRPRFLRMDLEGHASQANWDRLAMVLGITFEWIPAKTSEMAGRIERKGRDINTIVRTLASQAGFPSEIVDFLWNELVHTAVLLHNITPTVTNGWKSPWLAWHSFLNEKLGARYYQEKPDLSYLKPIGCKAFPLNEMGKAIAHHESLTLRQQAAKGLSKYGPRAHIGYLVGYGSSLFRPHAGNIFRIWVPNLRSGFTLASRDVTFNESEFYNKADFEANSTKIPEPSLRQILFQHDLDGHLNDVEDAIVEGVRFEVPAELNQQPSASANGDVMPNHSSADSGGVGPALQNAEIGPAPRVELTPETEPAFETEPAPEEAAYNLDGLYQIFNTPPDSPQSSENRDSAQFAAVCITNLDTKSKYGILPESLTLALCTLNGALHPQFASIGLALIANEIEKAKSVHIRDLPPCPRGYREAMKSSHRDEWLKAMDIEFDAQLDRGTYEIVPLEVADKIIDLMWVYVYKLTSEHYLERYKARLVARGDQYDSHKKDVYAATLAARSFRLLIAIIAYFDLDTTQLDAVTAFLNSRLEDQVYARLPPGQRRKGMCLKIMKALYGLPQSPKLWYRTLMAKFKELGLKPVPEEPCIVTNDWAIVFFYVDDIVLAFRSEDREKAMELKESLMNAFAMKEKEAYITDIAARFGQLNSQTITQHRTPRSPGNILPLPHDAPDPSEEETRLYLEMVGCLIYLAWMTRPDIAESVSKFAQFNSRPGRHHHRSVRRIIRYTYLTRNLSLKFGGHDLPLSELYTLASDASHGDAIDKKSHHGIVMKVLGGTIFWKAGKQSTVATSSTEAELIALTAASKEAICLQRLINQLNLRLPGSEVPTVKCDNRQTIRIATEDGMKIQTALRHIDIQQHWLRETVQANKLKVAWIPTTEMPADGMTKGLPVQKHQAFVRMLGLEDISVIDSQ